MDDLIAPQIKDSCKLALPNGLKELMSDITREVLRYQPKDLYKFIAEYLSAMLITRDNLSIAARICNDSASCSCQPELHDELRDIGLNDEEIKIATDIIVKYFEKDKVNEANLMMKLVKNTNLHEDVLPAVQDALRIAYLRHQAHNTVIYESSSNSDQDEVLNAAKHTMDLYRKTKPSEVSYDIMAEKIQKSYRAYGVKRDCTSKNKPTKVTLVDPKRGPQTTSYDNAAPKTVSSKETTSTESSTEACKTFSDPEIQMSSSMSKKRIKTDSSITLAGSFLNLPPHKPYSVYDSKILSNLEEYPEKEHAQIDYTADNPHVSITDGLFYKKEKKKISFNERAEDLEADESVSNSLTNSVMGADSDLFYREVMMAESNYDGDTEMEASDVN